MDTDKTVEKLQVTYRGMERTMLGISLRDRKHINREKKKQSDRHRQTDSKHKVETYLILTDDLVKMAGQK